MLNGFVTWCAESKLKATTIQSYIMAISHVQKAKGFDSIGFNKTFAKMLLNGVENLQDVKSKKCKPKKAITFKKLSKIKEKLKEKKWIKKTKWLFGHV
jgi:microsomal dipeptidase-like Zn-dependent dipeptidase